MCDAHGSMRHLAGTKQMTTAHVLPVRSSEWSASWSFTAHDFRLRYPNTGQPSTGHMYALQTFAVLDPARETLLCSCLACQPRM